MFEWNEAIQKLAQQSEERESKTKALRHLEKCQPYIQTIEEFLEWLFTEKDVMLYYWVINKIANSSDMEKLIAEFFEIDLKAVEQEKRQLLEEAFKTSNERR